MAYQPILILMLPQSYGCNYIHSLLACSHCINLSRHWSSDFLLSPGYLLIRIFIPLLLLFREFLFDFSHKLDSTAVSFSAFAPFTPQGFHPSLATLLSLSRRFLLTNKLECYCIALGLCSYCSGLPCCLLYLFRTFLSVV